MLFFGNIKIIVNLYCLICAILAFYFYFFKLNAKFQSASIKQLRFHSHCTKNEVWIGWIIWLMDTLFTQNRSICSLCSQGPDEPGKILFFSLFLTSTHEQSVI